jgi:hypothetical protein
MVVITRVTSALMVHHSSVTVVMVMKVIDARAVSMVILEYRLRYGQQNDKLSRGVGNTALVVSVSSL